MIFRNFKMEQTLIFILPPPLVCSIISPFSVYRFPYLIGATKLSAMHHAPQNTAIKLLQTTSDQHI